MTRSTKLQFVFIGFATLIGFSAKVIADELLVAVSVSQSSTMHGRVATRAVDGNIAAAWWPQKSVTQTNKDAQPWWTANLGGVNNLTKVQLFNRKEAPHRLSNFYVLVSNSPFSSNSLSDSMANPEVTSVYNSGAVDANITLPVNTQGRYVRIQLQVGV